MVSINQILHFTLTFQANCGGGITSYGRKRRSVGNETGEEQGMEEEKGRVSVLINGGAH